MRTLLLTLTVCLVGLPAQAKYSGGTGEPNDPYQIATAADLIALGEEPNDYDKHFILTADIDLDPNLPGGRVFDKAVIAPDVNDREDWFQGTPFIGMFDGKGHTISHLTVKGSSCLGLFGCIGGGQAPGEVRDLGVVDINVTDSDDYIGGLAGSNVWGRVAKCYSTGTVSGNNRVGGLVGENSSVVTQCYSTGTVSGYDHVGGLVGYNYEGTVSQCYSTGTVNGTGAIGGLMGDNSNNTRVWNSFWDTQTSGQATSAGGTGKTTAEMQTAKTFLDAGWDFMGETANGTQDIWWINEGKGYPRLSWQLPAGMVFVDIPAGTFEMGDHDGVGGSYERPVHTVTLDGFQMSKYETTNAQYAQYLNAAMADGLIQVVNGRVYASSDTGLAELYCETYSSDSYSQIEYSQGQFAVRSRDGMTMSDHPVDEVYWYGAKAFCDYYGYRLPTEAQWEYAARGGYHDPYYQYPWGSNTIDCTKANYWGDDSGPCNPLNLTSYPYTSAVGYYGPQGAYGLCDMSGNVWEWCQDWYDEDYYSVSPASNPTGPDQGWLRVLRGGSWSYFVNFCRVAHRNWFNPGTRGNCFGFRVCR